MPRRLNFSGISSSNAVGIRFSTFRGKHHDLADSLARSRTGNCQPALAQSGDDNNEPAASEYDGELAKRLGADPYGMRNYVLAILKTGPNDSSITGEERKEIFRGHFANMNRLAAEGKLALAGPFGDNEQAFRGLFVLAVATIEEGRALTQSDPAVKAGVFVVEYLPWYGSAAVMQVNDIHTRIAEQEM